MIHTSLQTHANWPGPYTGNTHTKRKHTHTYICKYQRRIFLRKHRSVMFPSWLTDWFCGGFWERADLPNGGGGGSNMSEKWILATLRRHSGCWEREEASAGTNSGGVARSEAVWSRLSELICGSRSDICLNYTGKSQDTARTDGESSLFPSHAPTHTNTPCFFFFLTSCCLMCAKVKLFPQVWKVLSCVYDFCTDLRTSKNKENVPKITKAGFTPLLSRCDDQTWGSLPC